MKLFATIFCAILAAAAVIWAVWAYNEKQAHEAAGRLSILENMIKTAEYTVKFLELRGKINESETTRNQIDLEAPEMFARFAAQSLPRDAVLQNLRFNFSYSYGKAIELARANKGGRFGEPDQATIKWGDEMAKRMKAAGFEIEEK